MIGSMYLTMSSVILGGILNMIFTKTPLYRKHCSPIDRGKTLKDGKRLFGDNKTWTGFFSMIVFTCAAQIIKGLILSACGGEQLDEFYLRHENTPLYNALTGAALGFIYMLFELPNSFIKRRIDIPPGKTVRGMQGAAFFIYDQIDSLIGVMLLLVIISGISWGKYLLYILLGGVTHIVINLLLYFIKVRRNP